MLKGLDLAFMPYIVSDEKQVRTDFGALGAAGAFREQLRDFCSCLGTQMTRDSFMQHDKLHEYGCKLFSFPIRVRSVVFGCFVVCSFVLRTFLLF